MRKAKMKMSFIYRNLNVGMSERFLSSPVSLLLIEIFIGESAVRKTFLRSTLQNVRVKISLIN